MARITQQHIQLLNHKVCCTACKKKLFEGIIELGAICITCPNCGNEQLIISLQPGQKKLKPDAPVERLREIFYR